MGASDKAERDEDERDEAEGDEKSHEGEGHDHDEDADKGDVKKEPAKAKAEEKKPAEKAKEKPAEKAPAKAAASTKAPKDEADEEDEDDDDDDDDDGEDEDGEGEPAKPAPKPAAASTKKAATSKGSNPYAAKAPAAPARARGRGKIEVSSPRAPQGSLMKNMILFIGIIGVLAAGFAYLGKEEPAAAPQAPKWTVGQTVDVEITLVPNDVKELACAAPDEIAGKHCSFEAQGKPWTKGDPNDEKKVLRPYTTTDRVQFTAAGLWSQDALSAGKLPQTRFSVKCKYTVEGKLKNPNIRWSAAQPEQWYPQTNEWYAGSVSQCVIAPP